MPNSPMLRQTFTARGLLLHVIAVACAMNVSDKALAQIVDQGISAASNTTRSFQDASIARDSQINRPLDLLNDFYPAIEIEVSDHDNVRRRSDVDEQDVRLVVSPSLAYRSTIGRHQFYAAYQGTYTLHQDLDQEDAESNTLSANLGLDLTRRWDIDLFASVGESFEERGISGSRNFADFIDTGINSGPEEIDFTRVGADLVFGRKIGIVTAVLGFEHTETTFETPDLIDGLDPQGRDRDVDSIHFDVAWRFAAKTSVFARVDYAETDFQSQFSDLDNDQTNFLVGLRVKPSARLNGVVGIGQGDRDFDVQERDFEVEDREGFDGEIYYGNISYAISPFSRINIALSRTIEEPGDVSSDFFISDLIGASWTHSLTPRLEFNIYGKIIDDEFNNGREDQFTDWGLGLDYHWRKWLSAGVFYGELDRESNFEGIDFDDTFIGIRLRSDLRPFLRGRGRNELEPGSFGRTKKSNAARF